ncbi:TetR/AcrR family transcriptional regulator [Catellatospora paridis]|uniref:TetR/AcrR family transcriptional regulator n=1 Tax=Catellatospora paridis TaxID=1617086 RepID=UPI0012D39685|nr:TetR family transcriptional regulator C-terminal domain-containing protein [Catellatospora paridis]
MPKKVDADERRRTIAEAVFRVIETTGSEAVSLRDVAAEAGVSMGMVQHYFSTKDEMLMFALDHMGERVGRRLQARLAALPDPTPKQVTRAMLTEMLPSTKESRQEAAVSIAFFNRAVATPAYAAALRDGYRRLLTLLAAQLPPHRQHEADTLFFLTQGLLGPVLLGHFTAEQATALLDTQLDRAFA